MDRTKAILFFVLVFLLVVLGFIFLKNSGRERIKKPGEIPQPAVSTQAPVEKSMRKVTLFFLREEDSQLVPEERDIVSDPSTVREAEEVIAELIKGSKAGLVSSLPAETKLGQLFITKEGVAYVDFSKDLVDKHPSGSAAEISTVYSIVNSLAYNFKPIKKVFILIEGEERETLGGHISLDHPFLPDYSLIVKD
jgi:spore germination protein GerM